MNTNNFPRSRYLAAAVSAVLSLAAASTHAGPQNGTVTQGAATISTPAGNITQIDQTTSSVSIDWQSFDVAANEQVNFNQPTASSVALNRILTQDPSQILGSLNANGRVFLLNPNGIIFGASARVNVGSLVASSLDLTDADAAAGRYSFGTSAAQSGAIINHGALTAANGGSITLLGGSVLNTGLIVADYGTVNLGAGRAATLSFDGDGLMRFQIDAGLLTDSSGAQAAVDNTGQITADGGQVLLTAQQAGDVVARAVNNDGVIRAARVENVGGVIRLVGDGGTVVNSGTLEATASNGAGGEIAVLGENVSLTGTALVDVSGTHGGGTAYIGGGFAGADPALLNAQSTTVDAGAVIRADSMQSGDAGRVAVWSEGRTTFNGDILARAGGASGNGGFAEVSGRQNLRIGGHATLTSENGMAGSLLLDPGTINIVDGSDAASASDNEIGDEWIIAQLATPGTLTISTAVYGDGSPATLTVDSGAEITWGTASTLELIAGSSVSFEAGSIVRSTDGGSLTINSGAGVDFSGTLELDGNLSVTAGAAITQSAAIEVGGTTTISATNQAVTLDDPDNQLAGSIGIDAGTTVLANSLATQLSASSITGDFTLTSSGAITQTGALTTAANATFTAGNGESITLGEANAFGGTVTFGSTGTLADVTVRDTTAFDLQALNLSGDLNITADGISQSGAVSTGSLTLTSDGAVTLNANAETAGALTITAGTNINQTAGTITTNGATTLSAGQAIALTSAGNNFAGSVSITDAASAQLTDSNAIDLGASTVDGALTVNTLTGGFTQSGAISAGSLSLSAQDVTFSDNVTTGALTVTANGGIDQTAGTITATGNADFTAAGGSSISVAQATNRFDGTIDFNVAGGTLQNVFVADTTALQLQALNTAGNLTVNAESIAISGAVDVGGNASLTATANGISQTDVLTVDGTTTLSAAGQTITLTNTSNDFVGSVGITAANAQLADINAINLGTSNLTGTLEISAGGSLTQSGALNVGGDVTLDTGTGAITLDNVSNSFGSTIRVTAAGDTTLRNAAPTVLGTSMITGGLNVTSVGAITQTNALTVAGLTTIAASGQSVTLNGSNAFNGGIGVTAGSASITNSVATDLRASTTTGLLSVDSTGALTQSGNITAGSLTLASDSAVTLSADTTTTTGALTITAGTNINQTAGAIMAAGSTTLSTPGQTITLTSAGNDFTGSVSVTDAASAQLTDSNAIDLGASTVDGALTVNTLTGGFTQSGAISAGSLSLSAQDVTFSDNVTTGALTVTANGGIDQTAGTITATGNADFTAAGGSSISVAQATNRFDGTIDFNVAGGTLQNVFVADTTALQLQALNTAGNLTVNAESIAVSGAVNVGGNASLTATASGISQTDVLTVGGTTTLNAAGQTIQLTNTSNTFGNSIGITAATASLNNSVATT
uniref:beta strand repeat-containing protein n=1 Tax=Povalibacter sp. TaxID=1962978 RepID=UPI002C9C4FB1